MAAMPDGFSVANQFPEVDFSRLIRTCIVHDLGEAITGDVPAIDQDVATPKTAKERLGLLHILEPLPDALPAEFVALQNVVGCLTRGPTCEGSRQAETIMQHNKD